MRLPEWIRKAAAGPGSAGRVRNPGQRLDEAAYVAVDTELTGLDERRDGILSVGAVRMTGGRIDLSSAFYRLVKPTAAFKSESVIVHEIVPSDVANEPDIATVMNEFTSFCDGAIFIGYCLEIDLGFLRREAARCRVPLSNAGVDIVHVYEHLRVRGAWDAGRTMSFTFELGDLATCFDVPRGGAHHALQDAFVTAQIFQKFVPVLLGRGIVTVGDLMRIGHSKQAHGRNVQAQAMSNF